MIHEFDAQVTVEHDGTHQEAADAILERALTIDMALSLYTEGTLNTNALKLTIKALESRLHTCRAAIDGSIVCLQGVIQGMNKLDPVATVLLRVQEHLEEAQK